MHFIFHESLLGFLKNEFNFINLFGYTHPVCTYQVLTSVEYILGTLFS